MKRIDICPLCGIKVAKFEPDHGGTVTDTDEKVWHKDCWDKHLDKTHV